HQWAVRRPGTPRTHSRAGEDRRVARPRPLGAPGPHEGGARPDFLRAHAEVLAEQQLIRERRVPAPEVVRPPIALGLADQGDDLARIDLTRVDEGGEAGHVVGGRHRDLVDTDLHGSLLHRAQCSRLPEYRRRPVMSTRAPRRPGRHVALPPGTRYASPPRPPGSNTLTRGDAMAQLRIPLDAQRFEKGMRWKDYMAQMGDTRARTEENYAKSKLTDDERKFFGGINQVRHVMMLAENWGGDVHRNSPPIAHICEAMPGADLRVFLRDQNVDLRDTFLNNGYQSIPVVVFFDKDWNEIGRWIERAHAATTKTVGIRARTVDAAPPEKEKQDAAMAEFRKAVQNEYDQPGGGLWRAATQEVRSMLEQRLGLKK